MKRSTRSTLGLGIGLLLVAILIQLIPYGHDHSNPPVMQEPKWDSPQTRSLVKRACFDCHSNETVWPWYSNIAPVSWLVYRDVSEGREHINFSEWDMRPFMPEGEGGEQHQHGPEVVREVLESGEMPPAQYLLLHPEARLSDEEILLLIEKLPAATSE
jgi:hypothetical protein